MKYSLLLVSTIYPDERITLERDMPSLAFAEEARKNWREALGNKNWKIDRRPGLDTLDHLGLRIERTSE